MIHLQLKVINDRKIENAFTQFYETKGMSKWLMHFNPSLGIIFEYLEGGKMNNDNFFVYSLTQQGLTAMQTLSNRQEMKGYLRRYLLFLVSKEIAM